MRLLECNSAGQPSLPKNFDGDDIPEYAILSHTWGADTEEVTFQDLINRTWKDKSGHKKIDFCREQARRDGLQYFWVDTCCIDKSSSSELTEAINSMFRWYQKATKCYVYLSDVPTKDHGQDQDQVDSSLQSWQSAFQKSRWFTRGWTLQELVAPRSVEFFCSNRERLGDKKSLERQLHEITGIAVPALQGTSLSTFSIEERMSWAKSRQTKSEEDMAYSLLGIFDIHMSLIYSEGADNAFRRLRDELYKRKKKHQLDDLSIVSPATFNSTKRLKTACSQSSIPSRRDPDVLDPGPHCHSDYSVHSTNINTKQSLIDQLYFDKIDERLTNLTAAQGRTCRWFLDKSEYKSWHDVTQQADHSGFLWIKGNPGTGKSTLMKLLFEDARLKAKNNPSQITLSFFFLARGTAEEKSTMGLYRSLLHQLFEKAVELRDSLEWMTADGAKGIQRNGWNEEALKQTLVQAVQKLGSRSLTIFVDALDECDKSQASGMVWFFEDLCDRAREAQVLLQICFSSRHYPTVVIQKGIEVTLEDEIGHAEDIKHYIKSRLKLGKSKQAESLRSEIYEKSSSIFLWVVLVLDILNSEYPASSVSTKKIRGRLKEIPPKLSDLFEMILTRDGENLEQLQICLKWILFAARPLKPQELYFAVQFGLDKECSSYWDQEDVDLNQMKTFVRSSSKGLAEVTRNKASEVQFIHESVRDFLLGKYESQWSGASGNFVGHSHETSRNCCLAQLNASINQDVDIPDPLPKGTKAKDLRATIDLKFPFLEYSVLNALPHANGAQQNAIEQGDFLVDFPLQRWIFLNNTLERYGTQRYTKSVSILYILAEKNLADLIRIHPQRKSCFTVEKERYGPPIFAALATGSDEAVRAILEVVAETQPLTSPLHELCKRYCPNKSIQTHFRRSFTFSRRRNVLSYVAEHGDEILLTFLLKSGEYMVNDKDEDSRTALWWAVDREHNPLIKLLLDNGADIDSEDKHGKMLVWWAAKYGVKAMTGLLLETGAKSTDSRTPLSWAAQIGHEAVVKLLLDIGAKVNSKDTNSWTPLSLATKMGHEAIVKLLLDNGAEVNSKDANGLTPLSLATEKGHEAIVKLLLDNGAEVNLKDKGSLTALYRATWYGYKDVVKLLLENGANINEKDTVGRTALWLATERGDDAIIDLLREWC